MTEDIFELIENALVQDMYDDLVQINRQLIKEGIWIGTSGSVNIR